jgi:hypothetical protein
VPRRPSTGEVSSTALPGDTAIRDGKGIAELCHSETF